MGVIEVVQVAKSRKSRSFGSGQLMTKSQKVDLASDRTLKMDQTWPSTVSFCFISYEKVDISL
jgi:hypothetical protein